MEPLPEPSGLGGRVEVEDPCIKEASNRDDGVMAE